MIAPPFLQQGDTIGIVAVARKISPEELLPAINFIKENCFNVILGENIYKQDNQFSGTDAQRAADMQSMLNNPEVKAIISARGGYGTVRIIDALDFTKFKQNPKWIIGYSDITVLHSHLFNMEICSLHATMPINFSVNKEATRTLIDAVCGKQLEYKFPVHKLNRGTQLEGEIIGGNLSLLYALSGTPSDIDSKGKILFIEDLDEYLYHIDRMMLQLKRSGKLKNLKGLVIGSLSDMKDNTIPFGKNAEEIIREAVEEYNYRI
jgi:muramoyltetrapeptide carboxypeptidase